MSSATLEIRDHLARLRPALASILQEHEKYIPDLQGDSIYVRKQDMDKLKANLFTLGLLNTDNLNRGLMFHGKQIKVL